MNNKELNKLKQAEETTIVTRNSLDGTSALSDVNDPIDPTTKVSRSPRITQNPAIEINPFLLAGLIFCIILVWLIIASLKELFHTNPYGNQIKINNFSYYFRDMPREDQDSVFNSLYSIANSNSPEGTIIPEKGAEVRTGSVNTEYDVNTDTYTSTFLVDIPELQQSYNFWVYWSTNPNNVNTATAGYTVTALCPTEDQLIYPEFRCSDMQNSQGVVNDPIIRLIPIKVNYFNTDRTKYISYAITVKISNNNQELTVIITSYSGNPETNYQAALKKLQDLGIDPSKYNIEYVDDSAYTETPPKAD